MERVVALGRVFEELVEARKRASWCVAAIVIKGSMAQAGIEGPPSHSDMDDLRATLTSLRSICEEAQTLLKD